MFEGCRDADLWTFVDVSYTEVWDRAETDRHWGMVCTCAEHVADRLRGVKHISCCWNSKRLDEAWDHIQESCEAWRGRARQITEAECENDRALFKTIKQMLNQLASRTHQRFKYLGSAPWSFARTLSVAGAKEFLEQVQARPWDEHALLTRKLYTNYRSDLEQRAAGGEVAPRHQQMVKVIKYSPLDESAGEGYHRGTTHEKKRAAASSDKHLKQAARARPSIAKLVAFRKKFGRRAVAVFRHDWRTWKRALQPHSHKRWSPLLSSTGDFFKQFTTKTRRQMRTGTSWSSALPPKGL